MMSGRSTWLEQVIAGLDRAKPLARRASRFLPMSALRRGYWLLQQRRIRVLQDRVFLEQVLVAELAARRVRQALFVGCRSYTAHYPALFGAAGVTLWTVDVDPQAAAFGHQGHHRTADLLSLVASDFPVRLDSAVVNGVFGYGVNDAADIDRALQVLAALLPAGAPLVIGWNHDRSVDPLTLPGATAFGPSTFAGGSSRVGFENSTHTYDLLVRMDRSTSTNV